MLYPASDIDWRFNFYMIVYMLECTGMTQRDVVGREVGGGVHVWEHMYTHGGFMSMYGKTNTEL